MDSRYIHVFLLHEPERLWCAEHDDLSWTLISTESPARDTKAEDFKAIPTPDFQQIVQLQLLTTAPKMFI